jgi:hypothetical protein
VSYGLKVLQYDLHEIAALSERIMAVVTLLVLGGRKPKLNCSFTVDSFF